MADIETSFQAAIDSGKINGAIICVRDSEGRFTYDKAMGHRTLLSGEKKLHQLDDVLFLASATKLIATIAALQCVEDGLMTLDGDLSSIAPELTSKEVLTGFSEDGETPMLEPAARTPTLRMLLSHSAGVTYHFLDPKTAQWREKFVSAPEDEPRTVEQLYCYPLSYQPGAGWLYGPGLDWAGRLVERVTGGTLGEHLQKSVFAPLGITDGQFYPVTREDLRARLVDLTPEDPEAVGRAVLGGGGDMNKRTQGDFGGHGLFMTGEDYVKVLHSLLANDGKILKPALADEMFQHHLSPEATAVQQAVLDSPMGPYFRVGIGPETKMGHGLGGLLTLEDVDGWYGERTLTWGGGLTLTWFIDRKNGLCGVGAVQAALPTDVELATALKHVFCLDAYRKFDAWKKQQQTLS